MAQISRHLKNFLTISRLSYFRNSRNLFLGFASRNLKINCVLWNEQSMFSRAARTCRSLACVAMLFDYIVAVSAAETRLPSAWRWFNESDVLAPGRADRRLIRCTAHMSARARARENHIRAFASCVPRTRTRTILSLVCAYVGSRRVHAFISLSLKATVNIWIIKPPPRFETPRWMRLAKEREKRRDNIIAAGRTKGNSNNVECKKLTLRETGSLLPAETLEMWYFPLVKGNSRIIGLRELYEKIPYLNFTVAPFSIKHREIFVGYKFYGLMTWKIVNPDSTRYIW